MSFWTLLHYFFDLTSFWRLGQKSLKNFVGLFGDLKKPKGISKFTDLYMNYFLGIDVSLIILVTLLIFFKVPEWKRSGQALPCLSKFLLHFTKWAFMEHNFRQRKPSERNWYFFLCQNSCSNYQTKTCQLPCSGKIQLYLSFIHCI